MRLISRTLATVALACAPVACAVLSVSALAEEPHTTTHTTTQPSTIISQPLNTFTPSPITLGEKKPEPEAAPPAQTGQNYYVNIPGLPSANQLKNMGVVRDGEYKFTYYSETVLPGGGLRIPGRHICKGYFVCDSEDNIVVASSRDGLAKGSVYDSPIFGKVKVYDTCGGCDSKWLDLYVHLE